MKHTVGALFVVLFVAGGCSEPTGPEEPPAGPPSSVTKPVANLDWDLLRALLADPFLLELPTRLNDAPRGASLKSASDAAVAAIDARDVMGLTAGLDLVAAEVSAYREKNSPAGDDLILIEVIENTRARARELIAVAP